MSSGNVEGNSGITRAILGRQQRIQIDEYEKQNEYPTAAARVQSQVRSRGMCWA